MGINQTLHNSTAQTLKHIELAEERFRVMLDHVSQGDVHKARASLEGLEEALALAADWAAAADAIAKHFQRPPAAMQQPQWSLLADRFHTQN